MKRKIRLLILCWLCATFLSGCGTQSARRYRIVLIPKGTTHLFWQAIHAGAMKAAKEHGDVDIVWQGPTDESKHDEQRKIVERFVSESVSAIILAPSNRTTLVTSVEAALDEGIPVVIIDSGLEDSAKINNHKKYLGYVATDNEMGGRKAAQRMAELLKDKQNAKVLMLPYQAGSESTEQREKGFRAEIGKHKNITLIISNDEAGATPDTAHKAAENQLSRHQDLDGIFTPNESSTVGMLQALRALGRAGKVKLVGFDSSEALVSALKADQIHGLVLQDPFDMGYQSVKRAVAFLEGTTPANVVHNTNLRVATKANLHEAEIKALVAPDLSLLK